MVGRGGYTHEKGIIVFLNELRARGWKTINLKGTAPDGIAIKDNMVAAVEVITYDDSTSQSYNVRMKKDRYFMFDDVFFRLLKRNDEQANIENERVYNIARKKKLEQKINEKWDKYGVQSKKRIKQD